MKKETYAQKLAELLGGPLTDLVPKAGKKKSSNLNVAIGVSEAEIQKFRAAQGVMYFLQAPELFTPKVCPHCGEGFLVSRQYVKFCSYTCIAKDFEDKYGVKWSRDKDLEGLAKTVYEGNEPIWIKNLDTLRTILDQASHLVSQSEEANSIENSSLGSTLTSSAS